MATHDYNLANQSGSSFRGDLNNALSAIQTMNSNATSPGTTAAFMFWADTNASQLKIRNAANDGWIELRRLDGEFSEVVSADGSAGTPSYRFNGDANSGIYQPADNEIGFSCDGQHRGRWDSSGRLLIGTTTARTLGGSSANFLQIESDGNGARIGMTRWSADANGPLLIFGKSRGSAGNYTVVNSGDNLGVIQFAGADGTDLVSTGAAISAIVDGTPGSNDLPTKLVFSTTADGAAGTSDRLTITNAGQVLIGTTTASDQTGTVMVVGTGGSHSCINIRANNGDFLSKLHFGDSETSGAAYRGFIEYFHGGENNMRFGTNSTERMRINDSGQLTFGKTVTAYTTAGMTWSPVGWAYYTRSGAQLAWYNRLTDDGILISFDQASTNEGSISVSGSTVSYNGAHLSRFSQFKGLSTTDKSARPTIYQGTVLSNLDDMCEWVHADKLYEEDVLYTDADTLPEGKAIGDIKHAKGSVERAAYTEDNQQLNMTKVSSTEGDKNVTGVFWTWDNEDATGEYVNDFYVAMTGDMIIRVAGDCTVAKGDLMISAGDGTAKPQADDIVRSSTIAKVSSNVATATYADGSKAYPCLLMAC